MLLPRSDAVTFAARLCVLAAVVGVGVAISAVSSGSGGCDGRALGGGFGAARDSVCYELVRTLGLRMGAVAAFATVVIVLTFLGLSRVAEERLEGRETETPPDPRS